MDSAFAKRQLEKFGWTDGQGLGRNEDGISRPVKVGLKQDRGGVGLSPGEEFASTWWSGVFNNAISSISITNGEDGVVVRADGSEAVRSLTKRHYGRHKKSLVYGGFVHSKGASPCNRGDDRAAEGTKSDGITNEGSSDRLTDEDLWKACGGRTAHKAARHGLQLSGKLKRVSLQEQKNLSKDSDQTQRADITEFQRGSDQIQTEDFKPSGCRRQPKRKRHKVCNDGAAGCRDGGETGGGGSISEMFEGEKQEGLERCSRKRKRIRMS